MPDFLHNFCFMETRLSVFMVVILGLLLDFVALSQSDNVSLFTSLSPPPQPHLLSPPPPRSPHNSSSLPPPVSSASASPLQGTPSTTPYLRNRASPPPRRPRHVPISNRSRNGNETRGIYHQQLPTPKSNQSMKKIGKKIGLMFVGFAAILQIGVLGFLVYKRKQLLRSQHRYENYTS